MSEPSTYASAGVNIDEAQRALRAIAPEIQQTLDDRVIGGVGGFGGLFRAVFPGIENPVLVTSIDGVGTKTRVAAMCGKFDGLGADIVHHSVNDILCQGAMPLFFLDYFGAARLNGLVFEEVLRGASKACHDLGVSLIGGETAEMPGTYHDDEIDIIGTIVGVVDFAKRFPREKPKISDSIIGIASKGLHTNGYSLARRILFEVRGMSVRDVVDGFDRSLGDLLLEPHRCYFKSVYPLIQEFDGIRGIAHITGGGLYDNVPRILSSEVRAVIDKRCWEIPPLFRLIQSLGQVADPEMYRVFNMGIGMVIVADSTLAPTLVERLKEAGELAAVIGEITTGSQDVIIT